MVEKIEDWAIIVDYDSVDLYTPPELIKKRLIGRIGDRFVKTSHIVSFTKDKVTTSNSEYVLGKPSPKYKEFLGEEWKELK